MNHRQPDVQNFINDGISQYPDYKDSGVEWLGEIPYHWETKRIKHLLIGRKGAIKTGPFGSQLHSSEMMDSEIKVFNQRTVLDRDINGGRNYISAAKFDQLKAFETFPGDLLVTTRGTIGRCMIVPIGAPRGILHPCLLRIQIEKRIAYDHFVEYLIQESGLILTQLEYMSNATTIEVIYSDSLKEVFLLLPPLPEQRAIVAFLDRETAKIDALVAKKERLIELLQEKRSALISQAVTKGLDANVPTKVFGVEWLGEVPAHWEVKRLKYAATINPAPTETRNFDDSLEVSFVPMETVGEYGGLELTTTKSLSEVYNGYTYFREGDVLVAKITPCFENGKGAVASGLVNEIAFGTTELHILRVKQSLDRYFLFYLSIGNAFRKLGEADMYGTAGQKRVPESFILNLVHPLPPFHEQRAIADFLDRETKKIDALVGKVRDAIDRLKELRTALISAAVTGKIDVRDDV